MGPSSRLQASGDHHGTHAPHCTAPQGGPKHDEKPDLTLTISDANFAQLVMGKLNPQQVR